MAKLKEILKKRTYVNEWLEFDLEKLIEEIAKECYLKGKDEGHFDTGHGENNLEYQWYDFWKQNKERFIGK